MAEPGHWKDDKGDGGWGARGAGDVGDARGVGEAGGRMLEMVLKDEGRVFVG